MNSFKKNWFKVILLIAIISVLCFVAFQANKYFQNLNNFQLQSKCSDDAEKFYVKNGWRKDGDNSNSSYQNHFNLKLNKCFILLISSPQNSTPDSPDLFIDLYDALEAKHYAEYIGHNVCDKYQLRNECAMDAGHVWFSGNDMSKEDYYIDFSTNKDAKDLFMQSIHSFMNN